MVDEEKKTEEPEISNKGTEHEGKPLPIKADPITVPTPESNSVIEEAKAVNTEKKELLDREEKLQTRKEKLHAEQLVSGSAVVQGDKGKKTDKEYAEAYERGEVDPFKEDGYV